MYYDDPIIGVSTLWFEIQVCNITLDVLISVVLSPQFLTNNTQQKVFFCFHSIVYKLLNNN